MGLAEIRQKIPTREKYQKRPVENKGPLKKWLLSATYVKNITREGERSLGDWGFLYLSNRVNVIDNMKLKPNKITFFFFVDRIRPLVAISHFWPCGKLAITGAFDRL